MFLEFDDAIFDFEINFVTDVLTLLDKKLESLNELLESSPDPDGMGIADDADYLSGMGFVACQQYMTSTSCYITGSKSFDLIDSGPLHSSGVAITVLLNAAANYWKHRDEWDTGSLTPIQQATADTLGSAVEIDDYACHNFLCELTTTPDPKLVALIPYLEAWRDAVRTNQNSG
ncbi:MAG: hypothetical protein ACF787_09775 [Rhodopirellula sp. JB053]